MAVKINAGSEVKRGDMYFVDPYEIIIKEELRGRHTPPTPEQIMELAISMVENGQRQAVECRKTIGDRLLLNLGFTRTAAARLIRTGFEDASGKNYHDPNFLVKVTLSDANDEEAFYHNIIENCHRNATTPIDDAHNQRTMRDKYGKTNEEIAKKYQYPDTQKVVRLQKLLQLSAEMQQKVHDGTLPVSAALDLLELPEDKQKEAIAAATKATNGKVVASAVRDQVREHMLNDDKREYTSEEKKEPKKNLGRNMKDVRNFMTVLSESKDESEQKLGSVFLIWLQGKRTDKFLKETFKEFGGKK